MSCGDECWRGSLCTPAPVMNDVLLEEAIEGRLQREHGMISRKRSGVAWRQDVNVYEGDIIADRPTCEQLAAHTARLSHRSMRANR